MNLSTTPDIHGLVARSVAWDVSEAVDLDIRAPIYNELIRFNRFCHDLYGVVCDQMKEEYAAPKRDR